MSAMAGWAPGISIVSESSSELATNLIRMLLPRLGVSQHMCSTAPRSR